MNNPIQQNIPQQPIKILKRPSSNRQLNGSSPTPVKYVKMKKK
jgi:hypothetical protein